MEYIFQLLKISRQKAQDDVIDECDISIDLTPNTSESVKYCRKIKDMLIFYC